MHQAVLLVSHGTVDDLDDLPAFLANVRRGHPPSAALVAELRRRYEAVGGKSPLNAVSAEVALKLSHLLGLRVAWASRLWKPAVRDVVAELAAEGVERVVLVPLAQYSAQVYAEDAWRAADGLGVEIASALNWGQEPELIEAFARRAAEALGRTGDLDRATLVFTAHSLPKSVVAAGDPYEREVRAAADSVAAMVRAMTGRDLRTAVAFQSQGLSAPQGRPVEWLGPTLEATFDALAARGDRSAILAPIGFLADHVEILYDLDIEAKAMAEKRGLALSRTRSLNADDDFVIALAGVARALLA